MDFITKNFAKITLVSLIIIALIALVVRPLSGLDISELLLLPIFVLPFLASIFTILLTAVYVRPKVKESGTVSKVDAIILILIYVCVGSYFIFMSELKWGPLSREGSIATVHFGISSTTTITIAGQIALLFILLAIFSFIISMIEIVIDKKARKMRKMRK